MHVLHQSVECFLRSFRMRNGSLHFTQTTIPRKQNHTNKQKTNGIVFKHIHVLTTTFVTHTIRYDHGSSSFLDMLHTHLIAALAITHGSAMVLPYTQMCMFSGASWGTSNRFFDRQHSTRTCSTYSHNDTFKCASLRTCSNALHIGQMFLQMHQHMFHIRKWFATTWFDTRHGRTRALQTCLLTELPMGQFSLPIGQCF